MGAINMTCPDCFGAGCPECTRPKSRSGTVWTEADYRAHGYHQVKVRLPLDAIDLLDRLVEAIDDEEDRRDEGEDETSRAAVIDALIRCAPEVGELAAAIRLRSK
jgi:hypothetical protein